MPPDLDDQIEAAALAAGLTYSAWLADAVRKQFLVQDGLETVAEFERTHGAFSEVELAEAEDWAKKAIVRSRGSGKRRRQSA
jgi:hypothetical protein